MEIINFYKNAYKMFLFKDGAFDELKDNVTIKTTLYAFVVLIAINAFINSLISFAGTSSITPLPLILLKHVFGTTLITIVVFGLIAGIIYLLMKLFGGKEDYGSTFKMIVASSVIPTVIISIVGYVVQIIYRDIDFIDLTYGAKDLFFIILYGLVFIVFEIWYLVVMIKSLSKVHDVSIGKTALVVILSALIFIILFVILFVIMLMIS